ncbi:3-isopropylmalate dehydratase small subunit [Xanthomonas citri pv. citri]|nr:3-isopropylmalate dehydratase small subunit [Xanthomonas citri pv. citri]
MAMSDPFRILTSGLVVIDQDNVDTDQIVPARFMTTVSAQSLGAALFHDARLAQAGKHPLDLADPQRQRILLAGRNFGCGSSREHAVWAIADYGLRAILAPSIADIFRGNALNNGLLAIDISDTLHERLIARPDSQVTIDLENQRLSDDRGHQEHFEIAPFARHCLLRGMDKLDYLLSQRDRTLAYEQQRSQPRQ